MDADLELVVGGRPVWFPAVWLRDNCPCPDCLAPGTGQKLKDITDIPNGLAITRTEDAGESVGALPYAADAVAVRRWDDDAKEPEVTPPEFGHFEALLQALLKPGPLSSPACGTGR